MLPSKITKCWLVYRTRWNTGGSLSLLVHTVSSSLGWWVYGCGPLLDFTEWVKQCYVQKEQRSQPASLQSTTLLLQGVLLRLTLPWIAGVWNVSWTTVPFPFLLTVKLKLLAYFIYPPMLAKTKGRSNVQISLCWTRCGSHLLLYLCLTYQDTWRYLDAGKFLVLWEAIGDVI